MYSKIVGVFIRACCDHEFKCVRLSAFGSGAPPPYPHLNVARRTSVSVGVGTLILHSRGEPK